MELCNTFYKNRPGIEFCTKTLKCVVLPADGGKMVSLKARNDARELLAQAEGDTYKELTFDGSYVESECSAFDDMFPTIDPWHNGEREYADHGEACRLPNSYTVSRAEDGSVSLRLSVLSPAGDYLFSKIYREAPDGGLEIAYEAENTTQKPLKAIWASHLMLQAEEGLSVCLEENEEYEAEFMFCEHPDVAKRGDTVTIGNGCGLLQSAPWSETANAYKFYIKKPYRGAFRYGKVRVACENADYLGIWINNGCFKGMYNVAAEFCTGAYDTPGAAEEHGADVTIPAGGSLKWKLFLSITE